MSKFSQKQNYPQINHSNAKKIILLHPEEQKKNCGVFHPADSVRINKENRKAGKISGPDNGKNYQNTGFQVSLSAFFS